MERRSECEARTGVCCCLAAAVAPAAAPATASAAPAAVAAAAAAPRAAASEELCFLERLGVDEGFRGAGQDWRRPGGVPQRSAAACNDGPDCKCDTAGVGASGVLPGCRSRSMTDGTLWDLPNPGPGAAPGVDAEAPCCAMCSRCRCCATVTPCAGFAASFESCDIGSWRTSGPCARGFGDVERVERAEGRGRCRPSRGDEGRCGLLRCGLLLGCGLLRDELRTRRCSLSVRSSSFIRALLIAMVRCTSPMGIETSSSGKWAPKGFSASPLEDAESTIEAADFDLAKRSSSADPAQAGSHVDSSGPGEVGSCPA